MLCGVDHIGILLGIEQRLKFAFEHRKLRLYYRRLLDYFKHYFKLFNSRLIVLLKIIRLKIDD